MTIEQALEKLKSANDTVDVVDGVLWFSDGTNINLAKLSDVDPDWPMHLCNGHKGKTTRPAACGTCQRIKVEQMIVVKAVDALLAAGYALVVDDSQIGDESQYRPAQPTTNRAEILAQMMETDDDALRVLKDRYEGWVHFIYGNDGYDVISDYTMSLDNVLEPVHKYADILAGE